jgi:hypothetical protein
VVGTPGRLRIDLGGLARRMARPGVAEDLAAAGLADPCRLAYCYLTGGERLGEYLGPGALNTDDRPVLSYTTYGALFRDTAAENLLGLLAYRADAAASVTDAPPGAAMLRHRVAGGEVVLGHVRQLGGDGPGALAHYRAAADLLPGDPALGGLVQACQALLAGR